MRMLAVKRAASAVALACGSIATMLPATTWAQSAPDDWKFRAIVYGYFPDIGGTTNFPERGGSSISVDSSTIIGNLKFAFMGTFEATKGRFGILADILYMDVSGTQSGTRDISVGGHGLPASVTSNIELDLKGTVFELAGTYNVLSDPGAKVDVVAGARMLDLKQTLNYEFTADVGPIVGPGRSGSSDVSLTYWDAVLGAKGQFLFGEGRRWFVPWYADVGAGQSKLTYQAIGGLGYSFSWGQVIGAWRYLDYEFKSGSDVQSLDFNGPMIGVAFSW